MLYANASFLAKADALTQAGGAAHLGTWVNVANSLAPAAVVNPVAFWVRMQSAGSPSLAISIDYSYASTLPPSANGGFSTDPYGGADSNYLTESLNATFTAVWNGSTAGGGWAQIACPANMKVPYRSMRYRVVVSTADVTKFDLILLHYSGVC